jgi:hypothetical protein
MAHCKILQLGGQMRVHSHQQLPMLEEELHNLDFDIALLLSKCARRVLASHKRLPPEADILVLCRSLSYNSSCRLK